jgi:hypothetical protein
MTCLPFWRTGVAFKTTSDTAAREMVSARTVNYDHPMTELLQPENERLFSLQKTNARRKRLATSFT